MQSVLKEKLTTIGSLYGENKTQKKKRKTIISLQFKIASRAIATFLLIACFRLSPAQARTDWSE